MSWHRPRDPLRLPQNCGRALAPLPASGRAYLDDGKCLRTLQVTGGAPNKLSKIKVVRKSIARVLTVYKQSQRTAVRNKIKEETEKKKGKVSA